MNLENIIVNEVSQAQKCMVPLTLESAIVNLREAENGGRVGNDTGVGQGSVGNCD